MRNPKPDYEDDDCPAAKIRKLVGDSEFLEIPRHATTRQDLTDAMQIVQKLSSYDLSNADSVSVIEPILSLIQSDTKFPISVRTQYKFKVPKASRFFSDIAYSNTMRNIAIDCAPTEYKKHAEGAFFSASPSPAALYALAKKVGISNKTWNIDSRIYQVVMARLLVDLDGLPKAPFSFPYELYDFKFNPTTASGYPLYGFSNSTKKIDLAPYVRADFLRRLNKLKLSPHDAWRFFNVFLHRYFPKKEVKALGDDVDKVRLIGMQNLMADLISQIMSSGAMHRWQQYKSCFIGSSIWKSFVTATLKCHNHHTYNNIKGEFRPDFVRPADPYNTSYIVMDLSAQDWTFNPLLLFITLWLRIFSFDFDGIPDLDFNLFRSLFAMEMGYANAKIVQWLDDMWYMFLGTMCSGYTFTSHGDTMSLIFAIRCALTSLMLKHGIKAPMKYWDQINVQCYGDDTVISFPTTMSYIFDMVGDSPTGLIREFADYGMTLKASQTYALHPIEGHRDRMFTHIVDDKIVSRGISFLQRYLVKYDRDLNPMHPDSEDYYFIYPWRESPIYFAKAALDVNNWTSVKSDMYASGFLKAFGLLMDAGPNKVAHKYCRDLMACYIQGNPDADYIAKYHGSFTELFAKYGDVSLSLITDLRDMNYDESLRAVCNHIVIDAFSFHYREPLAPTIDVRTAFATEKPLRYYGRWNETLAGKYFITTRSFNY